MEKNITVALNLAMQLRYRLDMLFEARENKLEIPPEAEIEILSLRIEDCVGHEALAWGDGD